MSGKKFTDLLNEKRGNKGVKEESADINASDSKGNVEAEEVSGVSEEGAVADGSQGSDANKIAELQTLNNKLLATVAHTQNESKRIQRG